MTWGVLQERGNLLFDVFETGLTWIYEILRSTCSIARVFWVDAEV